MRSFDPLPLLRKADRAHALEVTCSWSRPYGRRSYEQSTRLLRVLSPRERAGNPQLCSSKLHCAISLPNKHLPYQISDGRPTDFRNATTPHRGTSLVLSTRTRTRTRTCGCKTDFLSMKAENGIVHSDNLLSSQESWHHGIKRGSVSHFFFALIFPYIFFF